jgi:hypothetical protein
MNTNAFMDDTFEHACREADRKAAARPQDRPLIVLPWRVWARLLERVRR